MFPATTAWRFSGIRGTLGTARGGEGLPSPPFHRPRLKEVTTAGSGLRGRKEGGKGWSCDDGRGDLLDRPFYSRSMAAGRVQKRIYSF